MSILIKDIEIPEDNTVLLRIYPESDGVFYVEQLDIDDDVLDKYWAVPVPEHGRLIDGDKLDEYLKIAAIMAEGKEKEAYIDARAEAKTMPTIIPADPADKEEE